MRALRKPWRANTNRSSTKPAIKVVNTATPGLVGYALADRADAIQLWEPAYTLLLAKKSTIRTLDLKLAETWKKFSGGTEIPYLGVAAHADWVAANPDAVARLYRTYKEAAVWVQKNPEKAAALISPKSTPEDQESLASLIRANERLGMNVVGAGEQRKLIDAVYKAGMENGYLKTMPSAGSVYSTPLK